MAKTKIPKMSRKEVLENAGRLIAGTIAPEKMGLNIENINIDKFVEDFVNAFVLASESERLPLTLSIGEHLNDGYVNGNPRRFSEELQRIFDKMPEKFQHYDFFDGILIYACDDDMYANFLP